jgi:Carboxypeptidase regulatory-like domain
MTKPVKGRGRVAGLRPATLLLIPALLGQTTGTLSLRGQVVDGVSHRPRADVDLYLCTAERAAVAGPVLPDDKGRFAFSGLEPGSYILRAERADFGTIHYGQLRDSKVRTIDLAAGDQQEPVLFRIQPRGSISGTILDEAVERMAGVSVSANRATWHDTGLGYTAIESVDSDDRGRYRITNVPAGAYLVCAQPRGAPRAIPVTGPVDFLRRRVKTTRRSIELHLARPGSGRLPGICVADTIGVDRPIAVCYRRVYGAVWLAERSCECSRGREGQRHLASVAASCCVQEGLVCHEYFFMW